MLWKTAGLRSTIMSPSGRSTEAVTSAHVVETGLALLERAPAIARRVEGDVEDR